MVFDTAIAVLLPYSGRAVFESPDSVKMFHATFPDVNLFIGQKANCRNIWR